jgi:hypothetical protein
LANIWPNVPLKKTLTPHSQPGKPEIILKCGLKASIEQVRLRAIKFGNSMNSILKLNHESSYFLKFTP